MLPQINSNSSWTGRQAQAFTTPVEKQTVFESVKKPIIVNNHQLLCLPWLLDVFLLGFSRIAGRTVSLGFS